MKRIFLLSRLVRPSSDRENNSVPAFVLCDLSRQALCLRHGELEMPVVDCSAFSAVWQKRAEWSCYCFVGQG